ncbi:MAG: hypothetical protein ACKJSK_07500 [Roseibacillus sp.]
MRTTVQFGAFWSVHFSRAFNLEELTPSDTLTACSEALAWPRMAVHIIPAPRDRFFKKYPRFTPRC